MFYGVQLKPGKTVSPSAENGNILHLSTAVLGDPSDDKRTYVEVEDDNGAYVIAALQKDRQEHVGLDLFLSDVSKIKLRTRGGKNTIHISGYFEPTSDSSDSENDEAENAMGKMMAEHLRKKMGIKEASSDENSDAENNSDAASSDEEKKSSTKPSTTSTPAESDEDEENDDDDDDEEKMDAKFAAMMAKAGAGDSDDDSESGDAAAGLAAGLMKRKADNVMSPSKKPKIEAKQSPKKAGDMSPGKKEISPAAKKTEKKGGITDKENRKDASPESPEGDAGDSGSQFEKLLRNYLKSNGVTPLSKLGSTVKKPNAVKDKLSAFLKSRPQVFKVENGNVSLAKN